MSGARLFIRKEQSDTLAAALHEGYLDRLSDHMRQHFPEITWNIEDDALRARLVRTIEHARGYGLNEADDVTTYAVLTFKLGERFDEQPDYLWAQGILRNPYRRPSSSIERVYSVIHGLMDPSEALDDEAERELDDPYPNKGDEGLP